ncbi:MAG: hypothetical protein E5X86_19720 [Mesorhizobium sp.]|uniref:hypothetical protein n=1 Tax=Mesorhizobium sp. TaxID=1871066 RepID=UPI00121E7F2A|nr:hypothetical protein [Mesorhizobium sp.]TIO15602.1 MAG: hypothetical protein E5X86_19720 [Mesorhizobium sp.]
MQEVAEMPSEGKQIKALRTMNSPDRNASLWLDDQIARAQNGVITQVIDLTPPLARVLLARNPSNRKISQNIVENYARDMSNGAWAFNGEPIIVSRAGLLNDGQHRCEGVIASEATIQTILVIGTERASRLTLDQGKMRMAGDYLGMNGHADSVALAAATKYVWQHSNLGMLSGLSQFSPTKSEVLDLVQTTPTIAESLKSIPSKGSDSVGGRSILAFLHWTITRVSSNKTNADVFIDSLVNGSNLGLRSPILYARNRLMANRGRLKPNEKAELMFRAWNAHRRGDKVASLPINGGALPTLER